MAATEIRDLITGYVKDNELNSKTDRRYELHFNSFWLFLAIIFILVDRTYFSFNVIYNNHPLVVPIAKCPQPFYRRGPLNTGQLYHDPWTIDIPFHHVNLA